MGNEQKFSASCMFCFGHLVTAYLLHSVQSASCTEPFDLKVVKGMVELNFFGLAILVCDSTGDRLKKQISQFNIYSEPVLEIWIFL